MIARSALVTLVRSRLKANPAVTLFTKGRRIGVEIKRADAPTMSPSMASGLRDLKLDRLFVVYPGTARYELEKRIQVLPLADCIDELS